MNRQQKNPIGGGPSGSGASGNGRGPESCRPACRKAGWWLRFSAFSGEVTENLFAVSAAPTGDGRPLGNARAPENADFVIRF